MRIIPLLMSLVALFATYSQVHSAACKSSIHTSDGITAICLAQGQAVSKNPALSPDGSFIVYEYQQGQYSGIYRYNLEDGSGVPVVTTDSYTIAYRNPKMLSKDLMVYKKAWHGKTMLYLHDFRKTDAGDNLLYSGSGRMTSLAVSKQGYWISLVMNDLSLFRIAVDPVSGIAQPAESVALANPSYNERITSLLIADQISATKGVSHFSRALDSNDDGQFGFDVNRMPQPYPGTSMEGCAEDVYDSYVITSYCNEFFGDYAYPVIATDFTSDYKYMLFHKYNDTGDNRWRVFMANTNADNFCDKGDCHDLAIYTLGDTSGKKSQYGAVAVDTTHVVYISCHYDSAAAACTSGTYELRLLDITAPEKETILLTTDEEIMEGLSAIPGKIAIPVGSEILYMKLPF